MFVLNLSVISWLDYTSVQFIFEQEKPNLPADTIKKFYGFASTRREKESWNKLVKSNSVNLFPVNWTSSINISDFYEKTSTGYFITHCKFQHLDCQKYWRKITTLNGICIEFNPIWAVDDYRQQLERQKIGRFEYNESELQRMSIIMGYNSSDTTYGWNGGMAGFTLHYSHFTDSIPEQGRAFPLSPGLIPIGEWKLRTLVIFEHCLDIPLFKYIFKMSKRNSSDYRLQSAFHHFQSIAIIHG